MTRTESSKLSFFLKYSRNKKDIICCQFVTKKTLPRRRGRVEFNKQFKRSMKKTESYYKDHFNSKNP